MSDPLSFLSLSFLCFFSSLSFFPIVVSQPFDVIFNHFSPAILR
jgi:hypothetical protein